MLGMIAAGICGYGHTIATAADLVLRRRNNAGCLRCYNMALAELEHIAATPLRSKDSIYRPDREDWVNVTVRKAARAGGYQNPLWQQVG